MSFYLTYRSWTIPADKIREGNLLLSAPLLSQSLEVDALTVLIEHDDPAILWFRRTDKLYYHDGGAVPIVFRPKSVERLARNLYRITATSTLGLLTEGKHYGGIYTGQTADEVIRDVCAPLECSVKASLGKLKLYGWLPIAAPRDNLAQVLFAIGASLSTSPEGVLLIGTLSEEKKGFIPADKIYMEASTSHAAPVTVISLTEHQYIPNFETTERTLFEGDAQEGKLITFTEPMHSLRAAGARILDSGANYARLSAGEGVGLYGYPYYHNTREVRKAVRPGEIPNLKEEKDVTLISLVNAEAVAARMAEFYALRETVNAPVIWQGERPGDQVELVHPHDRELVAACLQSADVTLSGVLKAQEKLLVGFAPTEDVEEDYYNARQVFYQDGEFVVPEGARTIRVVLISGGQGGANGLPGEDGQDGTMSGIVALAGPGGVGGAPGQGAPGGRVYQFAMNVTAGQRFSVHVGLGGKGRAPGAVSLLGELGEDSTFAGKSSASGQTSDSGYRDLLTGQLFAVPGAPGVEGKAGGPGGEKGEDFTPYQGGKPGISVYFRSGGYAYGGGGSGACWGSNGSTGGEGRSRFWNSEVGHNGDAYGGDGAAGPPPSAGTNSMVRGGGGFGGNGGPGGGGGGGADGAYAILPGYQPLNNPGKGGPGGLGSKGGDGGAGAVIVYFADQSKEAV